MVCACLLSGCTESRVLSDASTRDAARPPNGHADADVEVDAATPDAAQRHDASTADSARPPVAARDAEMDDDASPALEQCTSSNPLRELPDDDLYVLDSQGPVALPAEIWTTTLMTWDFVGSVAAQSSGFPLVAAPANFTMPQHPEEFRALRVTEGARSWTVATRQVGGFGVDDGTRVDLHFEYDLNWGPLRHVLTIKVGSDLAFVYAQGGRVASLPMVNGVSIQQGAALCTAHDNCGWWSAYALDLTDTATQAHLRLAPLEAGDLGPWTFRHAGDMQETSRMVPSCADWSISQSGFVAWRTKPLSDPARGALIRGDAQHCPKQAGLATQQPCEGLSGAACTYESGEFGLSTLKPVTCFCRTPETSAGPTWLCVGTNSEGATKCPLTDPPTGPCTANATCSYGRPIAVAGCFCGLDGTWGACGL